MKATPASTGDQYEPGQYEIRLKGHLDDKWADWFDSLTITRADNGETLLHGPLVDQAALHYEMILAGWLIVKGFNPAATATAPATTATSELLNVA